MLYITDSFRYKSSMLYIKGASMTANTYPHRMISGILYTQWAYWCSLWMAAYSYMHLAPGGIRTALILTPVLPAGLITALAYWVHEACDEYIRSRIRQSVTITALLVSICTLGYFILELFGWPRLSMVWINLFGWSIFNLQMLYVILRSR